MDIKSVSTDMKLPDKEIECVRKYPFTFLGNAGLRGLKRYYEERLLERFGVRANMLFPTTLNQVIFDTLSRLYTEEGFLLNEDDFESKAQYDLYIKAVTTK